jgi:hypothetical protein
MAIIYSYPLSTPKVKDLLIGTSVFDKDLEGSPRNNPTVSFTVQSIVDLIAPKAGLQGLQSVTSVGNTTTNAIIIANGLSVTGTFTDSTGGVGGAGQVLSSTSIGTAWIADTTGNNYFVTGAAFNTTTGVLSITGNDAAVGATIDLDGRYLTSAVTSVAATHAGNAFSVAGTPITSSGTLAITMNGITAQYVNGAGNLATLLDIPGLITSLTTIGTSGVSTLVGRVLNIPNYANTQNTLTTVGTSGVATLIAGVLNIPDYSNSSDVTSFTNANGTYISAATVNTAAIGAVTTGIIDLSAVNGPATAITPFLTKTNYWATPFYTSITTTDGTYIDLTPNSAISGAVTVTADLNAIDGTATTGTKFLSKDNTWDVPIFPPEADTLATVTARGATTAVASTFSGGLTSSGILTCNGAGANAYSYFTGNGGGAIPPSSFTHGMTQVWNNSSGSREWETFWATGADIEGDPAVPADGHAANAISYMSGYNRYAGASTSGTPVDTRMYKWYGNGELEILDMSTLPGGNARPTVSTPYITLPLSAGTNNSMLVRKSTKEVEFSASLSYNEALATLAILPASGTPSEIQMKSANGDIWKLQILDTGALSITGPF